MSYAVWRSAETWRGDRLCDTTRATCGALGMSRIAPAAAASKAGVPASSVGLLKTMTSADGGTPSSDSSSVLARADSRSSRMNPPALSWPGTCGANGMATSRSATHAPTTHHARRTTKRPSRSKGVTAPNPTREPRPRPPAHLLASPRAALPRGLPAADPVRDLRGRGHPDDLDHASIGDDRRRAFALGAPDHEPEREVPVHVPVHRLGGRVRDRRCSSCPTRGPTRPTAGSA